MGARPEKGIMQNDGRRMVCIHRRLCCILVVLLQPVSISQNTVWLSNKQELTFSSCWFSLPPPSEFCRMTFASYGWHAELVRVSPVLLEESKSKKFLFHFFLDWWCFSLSNFCKTWQGKFSTKICCTGNPLPLPDTAQSVKWLNEVMKLSVK